MNYPKRNNEVIKDRSLRREVLRNNANKMIHFKENRKHECAASSSARDLSSLVVNKWPMPVDTAQTSKVTVSNTLKSNEHKENTIKNININGRIIPVKVIKIIPATHFNLIQSLPDNAQKSENKNGISNSDDQPDLREQMKRINEQNTQILACMNRPKALLFRRMSEMKEVDEFERKIETNREKHILAKNLRCRIRNKSDTVMEVIELLFTTELISKFNILGLREKHSFKKLGLDAVIKVLSGLGEKLYYLELARCIHVLTERFRRQKKNKP